MSYNDRKSVGIKKESGRLVLIAPDDHYHNIVEYVELHRHYYRDKYCTFISERLESVSHLANLSNIDLDHLLICSTIAEKCNYKKSKYIDEIIQLFACVDLIESYQDVDEVTIIDLSTNFRNALVDLLDDSCSVKLWTSPVKPLQRNLFLLKSLMIFLYYFIIWFLMIIIKGRLENISIAKNIFISFFDRNISGASYNNWYFGDLHRHMKSKYQPVFVLDIFGIEKNVKRFFVKLNILYNNNGLLFIENFITLKSLSSIFIAHFRLQKKKRDIRNIFENVFGGLVNYYSEDIENSFHGPHSVQIMIFSHCIKKVYRSAGHLENVIFVREGQSWEKTLILAQTKRYRYNLYGYTHAPQKFWDLRQLPLKNFSDQLMIDDEIKICVNGEHAKEYYNDLPIKYNNIIPVEFIRPIERNTVLDEKKYAKLFLTDQSEELTIGILDQIRNLSKSEQFAIKLHPSLSYRKFKLAYPEIQFISSEVSDAIRGADLIICGTRTSVQVDAFIMGKQLIVIKDQGKLNDSPLSEYPNVVFLRDINAEHLNLAEVMVAKNKEQPNVNFYYIDPNYQMWMALLQ